MRFIRRFVFFSVLFLLTLSVCGLGEAEENMLKNGDFSMLDEEGMPEDWYTDAYILESGFTIYSVREGDEEHPRIAEIRNIGKNDARFAQIVSVEPDRLYCLSGDILAEEIEDGHGANLSIEGVYAFSKKCYDTGGEWTHIEYYGETGPNQHYLTVFARLGGYSGESTGKASFSNLKLIEVDSLPDDVVADIWYIESDTTEEDEEEDETGKAWPWLILISIVYISLGICAYRLCQKYQNHYNIQLQKKQEIRLDLLAYSIIAVAMLLRVYLSTKIQGYMVDVNCFLSWGHTFATVGPTRFYEATSFCDYPPLYTYILGLNSLISDAVGANEATRQLIFRFVPSLCDVTACAVLYYIAVKKQKINRLNTLFFIILLAFNPATIINSAAWGQMDSVLCLLMMLVALFAIDGKWIAALPVYVISVLVKPQALMLGPLGLVYIVLIFIRNKNSRKQILAAIGVSLAVFAAGVIPFSINQKADWIVRLYGNTLASYPYATINTANFYYILGGNWSKVEAAAHYLAPIMLCLFSLCYSGWWFIRVRGRKNRLIESIIGCIFAAVFVVYALAGASWAWVGGTAMVFSFVIILSPAIREGRINLLTYLGALLYILLYVFGIKMHERYLFPAILLLASSWILLKDRRILYLLGLFTITVFLNEGIVLDNSIRLGSRMGHLNNDTVWLADVISIFNVAGAIYAVYLSIELMLRKNVKERYHFKQVFPVRNSDLQSATDKTAFDRRLHWTRKDTLILSCITAVYTVISLLTLGSTKAPQTKWSSSSADEVIVFDLGKYEDEFSILYFAQVSRYDFSFSVSNDGIRWSDETWAQMDQGQCWKWKYVTDSVPGGNGNRVYYNSDMNHIVYFHGRYVRLSAQYIGLNLNEVLFCNKDGEILPAVISSHNGGTAESELYSDPENLLDEQDTCEELPVFLNAEKKEKKAGRPSWWNSTYFDEIYHARTAYEFLKGSVPYETSHPPLGKVLMSFAVAVFGMTPFGWRFAGALAGILMLPGMYLLAKQMTKKTVPAVLCCLFMTLDCMHLTQTQIATIDSFPVLFIIFAYFFMLRFLQTDIVKEGMKKILPDLAASGVFMGFSIASKWIGIYAGGGLAILFFWHCMRCFRFADDENTDMSDGKKFRKSLFDRIRQNDHIRRFLILCLWCVLFFVVIPLVIYLVSYIPYLAYNSRRIKTLSDYINEVWKSQIGMFNYHSTKNLGMDHPFYSPWWEWPVIGKPMYYAAGQYLPVDSKLHYSIFCFGNPVIWFGGLAALVYCALRAVLQRRYTVDGSQAIWHLKPVGNDPRYCFVFIGILAQYLPWVLVPRGTYIYHYFASLPFLMLAMALCFDGYRSRKGKSTPNAALIAAAVLIALAIAAFIILFPYASGIKASNEWLDIGKRILKIWY